MPFFFKVDIIKPTFSHHQVDARGMEARVLEGARLTIQRDLPVLYGA